MTVPVVTTAWYFMKRLEKSHRTLELEGPGCLSGQPPVLILSASWQERGLLNGLFGSYSLKGDSSSVMKAVSLSILGAVLGGAGRS